MLKYTLTITDYDDLGDGLIREEIFFEAFDDENAKEKSKKIIKEKIRNERSKGKFNSDAQDANIFNQYWKNAKLVQHITLT